MDYTNIQSPEDQQRSDSNTVQPFSPRPPERRYEDRYDRFQIQQSQRSTPDQHALSEAHTPYGLFTRPEHWMLSSSRTDGTILPPLRTGPYTSLDLPGVRASSNERQTSSPYAYSFDKPKVQTSVVPSSSCTYITGSTETHRSKSFDPKDPGVERDHSSGQYGVRKPSEFDAKSLDHHLATVIENEHNSNLKPVSGSLLTDTMKVKSDERINTERVQEKETIPLSAVKDVPINAQRIISDENFPKTSTDDIQPKATDEESRTSCSNAQQSTAVDKTRAFRDNDTEKAKISHTNGGHMLERCEADDPIFKTPVSSEINSMKGEADTVSGPSTSASDDSSTSSHKRSSEDAGVHDSSNNTGAVKTRPATTGVYKDKPGPLSSKTQPPGQSLNRINPADLPPLPAPKASFSSSSRFKEAPITSSPASNDQYTNILSYVKEEPEESSSSGSKITDIINICEKHVFGQTSSVQIILNICSQATGLPGCDRFCNQIISVCNQILSETYQNSHAIIDLCKNLPLVDFAGGKNKSTKSRASKTKPGENSKTEKPSKIIYKDDIEEEDEEVDDGEVEDKEDDDFDWKDMVQNSDSEDGLNQEDDPDWTAYWNRKKETRSTRSEVKTEEETQENPEDDEAEEELAEAGYVDNADEDFVPDEEEYDEPVKKKRKTKSTRTAKASKATKKSRNKIPKMRINLKQRKEKKTYVKGEFKCPECPKVFLTPRGFEKHQEHHKNGFRITCEVCGVACPSPSHFKSHMRTHTGERPFVCEVCGNSYAQMSTLKGHMLLHTDERPAQCEYCDYRCKSNKRLRRHMIIHTSEKKFICDNCGARFLRSASLKKHLQIHKDEWPFPCELCPKKFKSKVHLRRHEEVHRDEYKYQCPVCGKRIRQAGNLKTHMRTHNGEKPYKCDTCGKGFAHNVTRKQHQEQCRGRVEVLIQPPSENDYSKYNPALYMAGLKPFSHLH